MTNFAAGWRRSRNLLLASLMQALFLTGCGSSQNGEIAEQVAAAQAAADRAEQAQRAAEEAAASAAAPPAPSGFTEDAETGESGNEDTAESGPVPDTLPEALPPPTSGPAA